MNKRIKVLHIGLSNNYGGIESLVYSWLDNKPKNFQFDFISDDVNSIANSGELIKKGCNVFQITHRYANPIKHILELNNVIKNGNYDYVHFHVMNIDEPWPIILGNKNKCKVIIHCHSMYKNKQTWKENLLKFETKILLFRQKYLKLACSEEAGTNMFNNKFTVIENGIDISKYKYSMKYRSEIRKKYNIKSADIVIGHVGRYSIDKNYPFLLSTFSKLKQKNDLKLMLVGDIKNSYIDSLISNLRIKNRVVFTGKVDDIYKYYSAFDLYYMPSISEGMSISSIEAQSSGLKCVLSNGIPKSTKVSNNAVFIDLNEEEAISTINSLLVKKNNRKDVSIDKKYDVKNSSKKMFNYYLYNLDTTDNNL